MAYTIRLDELGNAEKIYKTCTAMDDPIFVSSDGHEGMVLLNMDAYRRLFAKLHVYQAIEEGERDIADGHESDAFEMLDRIGKECHV